MSGSGALLACTGQRWRWSSQLKRCHAVCAPCAVAHASDAVLMFGIPEMLSTGMKAVGGGTELNGERDSHFWVKGILRNSPLRRRIRRRITLRDNLKNEFHLLSFY